MTIIAIDISAFGIYVTVASLALGVLTWWIGKLLRDKQEITFLQADVKHLKQKEEEQDERIEKLEDEVKDMRRRR